MFRVLTAVLCLSVLATCDKANAPNSAATAQSPAPPQPVSQSAAQSNATTQLNEFSTAEEVFESLRRRPVSALDLGIYRLNAEIAPDLSKRMQAKHLGAPIGGQGQGGFINQPTVVFHYKALEDSKSAVVISIYIPNSAAPASDSSIEQLRTTETQVISFVRTYFDGPCTPPDERIYDQNHQNQRTCGGLWFYFAPATEEVDDALREHEESSRASSIVLASWHSCLN